MNKSIWESEVLQKIIKTQLIILICLLAITITSGLYRIHLIRVEQRQQTERLLHELDNLTKQQDSLIINLR